MQRPNLLVVCPPEHYALRNLEPIRELADVSVGNTPGFIEERGPDAEILLYSGLSGPTVSFGEVWEHVKNVKWVHSLSAGVEKFLIPEFVHSPVPLTNARGVFKRSLADFAILAVLYFYKGVRRLIESQRTHKWDNFSVEWLPGKIMAVVGYGEIGRECAMLAKGLGLKIYATRRKPEVSKDDPTLDRAFDRTQLREMLALADVVVAAAPLTAETRHMLSDGEFDVMKRSAILINVGRGPVVEEAALIRALEQKKIGAAALDVFETEPLPSDSPLWDMENVLVSPHCTDRTHDPDWLDLSMQLFVENFLRYRKGEALHNVVDKKAGY